MVRGTTPTFQLQITDETVDLTQATNVYATFKQYDKEIQKTGSAITVSAHQVDVYFTQEESLKFSEGIISVQLNWTYDDGSRACSDIINVAVERNLIGSVLQ